MEEVKKEKEESKEAMSYEQLKAYTQQVITKAEEVFKENNRLKQIIEEQARSNNWRAAEVSMKCLDYVDLFSPEFIEKKINWLEKVLDFENEPVDTENQESEETKESKEFKEEENE